MDFTFFPPATFGRTRLGQHILRKVASPSGLSCPACLLADVLTEPMPCGCQEKTPDTEGNNIEDSLLMKGTIFMTNNSEMLPIVYYLRLKKN